MKRENEIPPHSAEFYFSRLARLAVETRQKNNYGISACLVIRFNGNEFVFYGQNGLNIPGSPHAHAEMDALNLAWQTFQAAQTENLHLVLEWLKNGRIEIRQAPHEHAEEVLYTTLEPCPMCTVGSVINPDVKKVIMASEDTIAGALLSDRLNNLAPLWAEQATAHGITSLVAQSEDSQNTETYIPERLQELLLRVFFETRVELDEQLEAGEMFSVKKLGPAMNELLRHIPLR